MFKFNDCRVFADYADEQYIVLNYVNGEYYAFDTASSAVLRAFTEGYDTAAVAEAYKTLCGVDTGAEDKISAYLKRLLDMEILIETGDEAGEKGDLTSYLKISDDKQIPELDFQVFNDVADLLLMDPIHEVDDNAGWPKQKPEE